MHRIFKRLPLQSVESILDSVFDKKERSNIPELEAVLNKPFQPSEFLDSLTKSDELTDRAYKKSIDGRVVFPADKWRLKQPANHVGYIGDQTNSLHKENLKQHTALVVSNLADQAIFQEDKRRQKEVLLLGLLHDAGKKYLAATSREPKLSSDDLFMVNGKITGQILFPEQEKLSAYLAARQYENLGWKKEDVEKFIAAIYYQDGFKEKQRGLFPDTKAGEEQPIVVSTMEQFIKTYGDEAKDVLLALTKANENIPSYKGLAKKQPQILEGRRIVIEELDPFIFDLSVREARTVEEIDKKFYVNSQSDEFEKDARESALRELKKEQERQIREKHQKEYEEIIKQEAIMVEEQRRMEQAAMAKVSDLGAMLALASLKSKEEKRQKQRDAELSIFNHGIDLDGDGDIDIVLE